MSPSGYPGFWGGSDILGAVFGGRGFSRNIMILFYPKLLLGPHLTTYTILVLFILNWGRLFVGGWGGGWGRGVGFPAPSKVTQNLHLLLKNENAPYSSV